MTEPHFDTPARKPKRLRRVVLLALIGSLAINLVAFVWYLTLPKTTPGESKYLGDDRAVDKIAVVRISGVINEATIGWPLKQLEQASTDPAVKAIVVRIDSPGGTIFASDELYQSLVNARDNTGRRWTGSGAKPMVTSMGSLAASGGYYTAVVGTPIFAERTTITGSIGVFAAIPNAAEFGEKHGIRVELIKAGGIKASGSIFTTMSPLERQPWQEMVDAAYDQFLSVIAAERTTLSVAKLKSETVIETAVPKRDAKGNVVEGTLKYTRIRADGGTFTAAQAKQFGLVDEIGDLPAAIAKAAERAGRTKYKAIVYEKPKNWSEHFLGLDLGVTENDWRHGLTPKLWYLAPNAELAAVFGPR
jgi:protease-4